MVVIRRSYCFLLIMFLTVTGCRFPSDMVLNFQGKIIDEHGALFYGCSLALKQKDKVLISRGVGGEFQESMVVGGLSASKLLVSISCDEGSEERLIEVVEIPKSITDPIMLGLVEIKRVNSVENSLLPN